MARRYCPDCRTQINNYPMITNTHAPDDTRIYIYRCPNCSEKEKTDVVIAIIRKKLPEKNFHRDMAAIIFKMARK